ncbi:hypothetical protein HAX54_006864 [Datura stramonium]|uniref:Non-specific lipid-transfer protein n=1 Tax=Datura stramonium TaxID=4076 RepID=A0ABS8TC49_DATST|nr:hypothetical protein [Datura stramonium]
MASSKLLSCPKKPFSLFLICAVLAAALSAEALLSCGTVLNNLQSCMGYVLIGGTVPPECCSGLKSLISTAKTIDDRKSFCSCIKGVASGSTSEQVARAAGLPRRCNAHVPFKINLDVDCSKKDNSIAPVNSNPVNGDGSSQIGQEGHQPLQGTAAIDHNHLLYLHASDVSRISLISLQLTVDSSQNVESEHNATPHSQSVHQGYDNHNHVIANVTGLYQNVDISSGLNQTGTCVLTKEQYD